MLPTFNNRMYKSKRCGNQSISTTSKCFIFLFWSLVYWNVNQRSIVGLLEQNYLMLKILCSLIKPNLTVFGISECRTVIWNNLISLKSSISVEMGTETTQNKVICRYRMHGKDWTAAMHPIPYDIRDFCEGIGNYSNGMMIIAEPGYYQVTASLANRDDIGRIRIRKNSECCYSHSYGGWVV